jgi:hypothetical protein
MFLESLGTTMLLSLGRLPPCREPTSSNNVLHDIALIVDAQKRRAFSSSSSVMQYIVLILGFPPRRVLPPRDLLVNSLVAREEEAHGRPKEVLIVIHEVLGLGTIGCNTSMSSIMKKVYFICFHGWSGPARFRMKSSRKMIHSHGGDVKKSKIRDAVYYNSCSLHFYFFGHHGGSLLWIRPIFLWWVTWNASSNKNLSHALVSTHWQRQCWWRSLHDKPSTGSVLGPSPLSLGSLDTRGPCQPCTHDTTYHIYSILLRGDNDAIHWKLAENVNGPS